MICKGCGAKVENNKKFCAKCGQEIKSDDVYKCYRQAKSAITF